MHTPGRGNGALRRYRVSLPATTHFLTLNTVNRTAGLTCDDVAPAICAEITAIATDGHWLRRAAVVMPDHLHVFVRLTGGLPIARCVARLKSNTRSSCSHATSHGSQISTYIGSAPLIRSKTLCVTFSSIPIVPT